MRELGLYLTAMALASLLGACSDGATSMTGPAPRPDPPAVSDAQVLVGGQSIHGVIAENADAPTLFGVRIHAPGGLPTIQRVVLQYAQPGRNHHGGADDGRIQRRGSLL